MINILILFIHILIMLFNILYVFCIKNKQYDYIYLSYIYFILLHWTFLKGECICSYIFKKIENNNYELGSSFKNDELYYIFGEYRSYIAIFLNIMVMINVYMVCKRNNIKNYLIFIFILLFQSFSFNFYYFTDNYINTNFQFFNDIIKITLIFFGLYIFLNQDNIVNKI
jgi:hypothetical protein